jgi:hypothetical protein
MQDKYVNIALKYMEGLYAAGRAMDDVKVSVLELLDLLDVIFSRAEKFADSDI